MVFLSRVIMSNTKKTFGNRRFYALPEDYALKTNKLKSQASSKKEDSNKLIKYIDDNVIGKNTTFAGPFGRRKESHIMDQNAERDAGEERLRMWSAVSFSVLILGAGLPLWWRTTEVTRVALPYDRIDKLAGRDPRVGVEIELSAREGERRAEELRRELEDSGLFEFKVSAGPWVEMSVEQVETSDGRPPGTLLLRETRGLDTPFLLGNLRTLYFAPEVDTSTLVEVVKDVLEESRLVATLGALETPGRPGQDTRLKSESCFDLLLSVVHPEPHRVLVDFDAEVAVRDVIAPMLSQLSALRLRAKSQWLHYLDLGVDAKMTPDGWQIPEDKIAHVVSPLEKKLGSGVSVCPCLHFVVYVARCTEAPLKLGSGSQNHAVSPKWGGIQILNPGEQECKNGSALKPDVVDIARILVSQLRQLLGLRRPFPPGVSALPLRQTPLRLWELDALYRNRALEQTVSARLTLVSLARLLGEISNIVINEEVGQAIESSVEHIEVALERLNSGLLEMALESADVAYVTAETAFGHPSLLALLYFPDDQKYAVYIPLFLPVMIPVVLSLKTIYRWFVNSPKE